MDAANIINLIFGLLIAVSTFFMQVFWKSVSDLRREQMYIRSNLNKTDKELTGKIQEIDKVIAGAYVQRKELERLRTDLFIRLDRIENKIDTKADKKGLNLAG